MRHTACIHGASARLEINSYTNADMLPDGDTPKRFDQYRKRPRFFYQSLIREHGPIRWMTLTTSRIAYEDERTRLGMDYAEAILIIRRTMARNNGHPIEVTEVKAPRRPLRDRLQRRASQRHQRGIHPRRTRRQRHRPHDLKVRKYSVRPHAVTTTSWQRQHAVGMIRRMHARTWLNTDDQFMPGAELFRSDRAFTVWAYTISHSQLLLRTRTAMGGGAHQSRIDIVFKPVEAMKLRIEYHGLIIRCATQAEIDRIHVENSGIDREARCLILETAEHQDYVVTHAVGWEEDMETDRDPSKLAGFAPASDPNRILE